MKAISGSKLVTSLLIGLIGVILLLIFPLPCTVNGQSGDINTPAHNKAIIKQGFDNWAHNTGSFFDLLADNVQWTITGSTPFSKTYTNKKQFMDEVINPLNDRLSKRIVPTITNIYADGDEVIVLWDGKATAADGKPYNAAYSWNMQLKNGKIIKVVAFLDGIEFADIMSRIPIRNN